MILLLMILIGRSRSMIGNEFHRTTDSVKIGMTFFVCWKCIVPQLYTVQSGNTNGEWNIRVYIEIVSGVLKILIY